MPIRGKNYKNAVAGLDRRAMHDLSDAIEILLKALFAKFD